MTNCQIPNQPLLVVEVKDEEYGLEGWVAVHSFGQYGSCGGIRLYPDVSREEVELLAKGMTYKYCFHGRQTGGAKAGLRLGFDLSAEERAAKLRRFGEHIAPLIRNNIYYPWTDMNSTDDDIANIFAGAKRPYYRASGDSSYYTAISTYSGVVGTLEHLKMPINECNISIQGLGNVGKYLAMEIKRVGAKVVAASTRLGGVYNGNGLDIDEVVNNVNRCGDEWVLQDGGWEKIGCDDVFSVETDVFVPAARVHSITEDVAKSLKCKAVVPAANAPFTDGAIEELYNNRGIIVLPYFVTNSGGVVPGLSGLGESNSDIREIADGYFKDMFKRMLVMAEREDRTPIEIAKEHCNKNFEKHSFLPDIKKSFFKRITGGIKRRLLNNNRRSLKTTKLQIINSLSNKFK